MPALLGALALIAAIILSSRSIGAALTTLALILILLGVCAYFIIRSMRKGRLANSWLVLRESVGEGALSAEEAQSLVGLEGVCLNTLRPAGNADFDGKRLDVVSEGEFIQKGSRVKVERVEGFKVIVRKIS
jgi:membrane protein implicated in regulation of membrane protease activity